MKRGAIDHPKMRRLWLALKIPQYAAIGLVESLFHFTAKFARQGNIGKFGNDEIAAALAWEGNPDVMVHAFVKAGWLEERNEHRLIVHDWHDHADQSVKKTLGNWGEPFLTFPECFQNDSGKPLQTSERFRNHSDQPVPEPVPEPVPGKKKRAKKRARPPTLIAQRAAELHWKTLQSLQIKTGEKEKPWTAVAAEAYQRAFRNGWATLDDVEAVMAYVTTPRGAFWTDKISSAPSLFAKRDGKQRKFLTILAQAEGKGQQNNARNVDKGIVSQGTIYEEDSDQIYREQFAQYEKENNARGNDAGR